MRTVTYSSRRVETLVCKISLPRTNRKTALYIVYRFSITPRHRCRVGVKSCSSLHCKRISEISNYETGSLCCVQAMLNESPAIIIAPLLDSCGKTIAYYLFLFFPPHIKIISVCAIFFFFLLVWNLISLHALELVIINIMN